MKEIKLLDCTLRDGGYLNDWEFGHNTLISVCERLVDAAIDVIEIGFLDERRPFDENRSIFPDSASVRKVYGKIDKKDSLIVGMIDYGTCSLSHIEPCEDSYLDGIRVIFKKHKMIDALNYCAELKKLGYTVFTQAVSITSYNDDELLELISRVNQLRPFALSMVDTYGLLQQDNLMHIFNRLNEHLLPEIAIGYHAHNNFQLGYANCMEVMRQPVNRTLLVDGSLYGMGKSAGNAPVELIAMHLNEVYGTAYDISQLLEAIEINILPIEKTVRWGYNLFYYISAKNKCHPSYVSYLMNMHTLSTKSINEILREIPEPIRLLYDAKYIEQAYLQYQQRECNDEAALEQLRTRLQQQKVLILGPGKTVANNQKQILSYIERERPIVISINFIPEEYHLDYLFLSNSKRYVDMAGALNEQQNQNLTIIATSNVTKTNAAFPYVLNYRNLIDSETEIPDNSLVMLLRVLVKIGVEQVALAGLDGYRSDDVNYYVTNMEYSFAKEKATYLNDYVKNYLKSNENTLTATFVTESMYHTHTTTPPPGVFTVLITGASRGIGLAVADLFRENGCHVICPQRNELDLLDSRSVASFVQKHQGLQLDAIINNAGINEISNIEDVTDEEMNAMLSTNLIAPISLLRGFIPMMKQRKSGHIVNITSVWSVVSKPGRALYSATKHAMHGITQTLALELAPYNILVNSVAPGFTLTELTYKNNTEAQIDEISKKIPLSRMAAPEEIAQVVFNLASEQNTYITGQQIVVDGGYTIQ